MANVAASSRSSRARVLARLSFLAWTFALILLVNRTFEWSFPYCNIQDDGPAKPAYGFPLPYLQPSTAFSLSPDIMPHALLFNMVLLAALAYPVMGWAVRRLSAAGSIAGAFIAVPGLLLALLLGVVHLGFEFQMGQIVGSVARWRDAYWDYRPLGIILHRTYYDCTPSEFWFGPIRNPRLAKIPGR